MVLRLRRNFTIRIVRRVLTTGALLFRKTVRTESDILASRLNSASPSGFQVR